MTDSVNIAAMFNWLDEQGDKIKFSPAPWHIRDFEMFKAIRVKLAEFVELSTPNMFWFAEDSEQMLTGENVADVMDAVISGEVTEIERARRLPNVFAFNYADKCHVYPTEDEAEDALEAMQIVEIES